MINGLFHPHVDLVSQDIAAVSAPDHQAAGVGARGNTEEAVRLWFALLYIVYCHCFLFQTPTTNPLATEVNFRPNCQDNL